MHTMEFETVMAFLFFFMLQQLHVEGDYGVRVKLIEYNRKSDDCCDGAAFWCTECDPYFKVCLQAGNTGYSCQGDNNQEHVADTHSFLFSQHSSVRDSTYVWNHINGNINLKLFITVTDIDDSSGDDPLGTTTFSYTGSVVNREFTSIPDSNFMRVRFQLSIYCHAHFYGPSCSRFCIPNKNQECTWSGVKVCKKTYFGTDCSKRCIPTKHTFCDSSGNLQCKMDYVVDRCRTNCLPTDSIACNYTNICKGGNCNSHCCQQCMPSGHFDCTKKSTTVTELPTSPTTVTSNAQETTEPETDTQILIEGKLLETKISELKETIEKLLNISKTNGSVTLSQQTVYGEDNLPVSRITYNVYCIMCEYSRDDIEGYVKLCLQYLNLKEYHGVVKPTKLHLLSQTSISKYKFVIGGLGGAVLVVIAIAITCIAIRKTRRSNTNDKMETDVKIFNNVTYDSNIPNKSMNAAESN